MSSKVKVSIVVSSLVVFLCTLLFVTTNVVNKNTDVNNNSVDTNSTVVSAKTVPQSADEIYNSIPSRETIENFPAYINKSIELTDKEAEKNYESRDISQASNNFSFFTDVNKIYAVITKDEQSASLYKLQLTANKPEEGSYEAIFEIDDTSTDVPAYCAQYASKFTSVTIDESVNQFHPVSTKQWFGSYVQDSKESPTSKLTSIDGLRYINVDKVQDASYMFSGTSLLKSLSQEDNEAITKHWNFSSLNRASGMFIQSGLDSDTLSTFLSKFNNNSNLQYCQYVFSLCANLKSFNLKEQIMLPNVLNASFMFARSGLEKFNDNIVFGKPIFSLVAMFYECKNMQSADVSSMLENGSSYCDVYDGKILVNQISATFSMFHSCEALTEVDLGKWDISSNENAAKINYTFEMFKHCILLHDIKARYDADWSKNIKDSSFMFESCEALVGQNRTAYNNTYINHVGYARIDEGKTNPGYFTLSKKSPEPPMDKESVYSLEDDTQNGVSYFPVCDDSHKLPEDLNFYDGSMNKITPSNGSYYVMSDLKGAKYFTGTSAFDCFRSYDNVKWEDVFFVRDVSPHEYYRGEVKADFQDKLLPNESVLCFDGAPPQKPAEPQYHGIPLSDIYNSYSELLKDNDSYWSNCCDNVYDEWRRPFFVCKTKQFDFDIYSQVSKSVFIQKTLDPKKMTPKKEIPLRIKKVCFDYDDSIVAKVTNITGDKTYPKNTKINYTSDEFKFKVVMRDGVSVPRAFDGKNEIIYTPVCDEFTIDNRYGLHCVYIDKQTTFNVAFSSDQYACSVTDRYGHKISDSGKVSLNGDFEFKLAYLKDSEFAAKEVKVDGQVIEPDKNNLYVIKNVTNHKSVIITSQETQSLVIKDQNISYLYHPIFNTLSADKVKFYDDRGNFIYPSANNEHDYVMSDLKNAYKYIANGYKFQAIRTSDHDWSLLDEVKDKRATHYKGDLLDGDYCSTLSFNKDNFYPQINGVFIGDIVNAYKLNELWSPDEIDDSTAFIYNTNLRQWTKDVKNSTHSFMIQHEFTDCYNIKFEGDNGVKQIVDENGQDITYGTLYSKNNPLKFKIKCYESRGIDTVEQSDISIDGRQYDPSSLNLDNSSLIYTTKNIEDINATGCVIKISTTNVCSFKTDKGLYHPIFKEADNVEFSSCRFYDDDGQCLTASYGDETAKKYSMKDITYTTKYKILDKSINDITAVRSIAESKWDDVFDRDDKTNVYVRNLTQNFRNKLNNDDTVYYSDYTKSPYIPYTPYHEGIEGKDVSLIDIYEAFNQNGFGIRDKFHFFINYVSKDEFGYFWSRYDEKSIYYNREIKPNENIPNGCCMVVSKQFGKTDPTCTVEFHKDEGVEKITDRYDKEISVPYIAQKDEYLYFHVYYKDGYVENQVIDGMSTLQKDKENLYCVNYIRGQRVVNISSKKAVSLKCPDFSKHPDLYYKPAFNKISVHDVKFYDKDGHFIPASQDNGNSYIMDDLKNDAIYFVKDKPCNFKAVLMIEHSWDEAFGKDTQGKATNYLAGDNDFFEKCANLDFNQDEIPFINDATVSDIIKAYYESKNYFIWGNYVTDADASVYHISFDFETQYWTDLKRFMDGQEIFLTKDFKDSYTINFSKDNGIEKFVDDQGKEIDENIIVQVGTDVKFKPVCYSGFATKEITVSGQSIKPDSDGYYHLANCDASIEGHSYAFNPQSLIINGSLYRPAIRNFDLSSYDIRFYDAKGNYLPATGAEVPGFPGAKYYVMSDLKNATQYESDSQVSFSGVRTINEPTWANIFVRNGDDRYYNFDDLQPEFKNHLNKDDSVMFFDHNSEYPPMIEGRYVKLTDVYQAYKDVGFGSKDNFHFWTSYVEGGSGTSWFYRYFSDYNPENGYCTCTRRAGGYPSVEGGCNMVVAHQFYSTPQVINLEKTEEIERFTDEEGHEYVSPLVRRRNEDIKIKVILKEGYALDRVYLNGQPLESDKDGVYNIKSPFFDIKVTTSCKKTQSLLRDGVLYRPIFDKANFDDVKFYDNTGNLCRGESKETFTMQDTRNAIQYIAKDNYKFKAIKVLENQSWEDSFGKGIPERAQEYIQPLKPEEQCSNLSFVNDDGDLYLVDYNQNNIFIKDIQDTHFKGITSFWTSSCSIDKAWNYCINVANSNWGFLEQEKNKPSSIILERIFSSDTCKVNFNYDENTDKIINLNGSEIDKTFDYPKNYDLKFKVISKKGYLVDNVYVNGEKILSNNDGVYVVRHVDKDVNIKIESDVAHSLVSGGETFHPVGTYIPSDKVKFYDKDSNYIHATGNNGLSYLMSDLGNATQFISKDYAFEAVATREQSWKDAFGELEGPGVASKYIPHIECDQTCASLKFDEPNSNLYISGVSVDDIVKAYFGSMYIWTSVSQSTDDAYCYANNQWLDDFKTNSHAILLQKTFSSIEKTRVNFELDDGVEYLQDSGSQAIDEYFDFVPGQELKFKIIYKNNFVLNSIKFNNEDLLFERDGYFHILMNSSLIGKSSKVDVKTQKAHSLKVDDISYKPLYETLSSNDYKFYDINGDYINPSNGDNYVMSDFIRADKFIYQNQGSYELNTVGLVNHTWDEAFGNDTQGKAKEYKAGDVDSSIQCSTLTFDKDKDPTVEGFSLTKIKEIFPGVQEFWGNEANSDRAWSYQFNSGVESGSWLEVRSRITPLPILMNKKFTSFSTIHFEKDLGIKDFISDDGSAFAPSFTMQSDNRLRFKVALNDTFVLDSLTINGKPASADSEGYYTIDNVNSFKLVKAESCTNIKFIKNEGIEKLVDANDQELPENVFVKKGSDFRFKVVCKQNFNNEYVMINNQPILKDYDDFYTIKNIASSVNVAASSYSNKHSLIVENDLYHPAFDKISNEKILFYDNDGKLIQATGDDVQGREGYKYYLSNDTVDASYYAISDDLTSFTAVRSVNNVHWNDAFDEHSTLCRDVKEDFRRQHLHTGDSPYIFNYDKSEIVDKPKINGIELTSLYNIYNKHGFGTYNAGGHFWVNWQYALGYTLAYYWDSANNKLSESQDYKTSNVDIVITREFSNKMNVQKDKGLKEFVDINGDTITGPIYVGYDKHLNFKTVCNDRLKRKQVTFNGR